MQRYVLLQFNSLETKESAVRTKLAHNHIKSIKYFCESKIARKGWNKIKNVQLIKSTCRSHIARLSAFQNGELDERQLI